MPAKSNKPVEKLSVSAAKGRKAFSVAADLEPSSPDVKEVKVDRPKENRESPTRFGTDSYGERVYTFLTPLLTDLFLEGVCRTNNVTQVCAEMNVSRMMIYAMKAQDPVFRQRLYDAQTIGIDSWEDAAATRAFNGVDRKVFHQGIQIDTVKDYSDSIAITMLRGAKPERYATRTDNTTVVGGSIGVNLETLSDDELNEKINKRLSALGSLSNPR